MTAPPIPVRLADRPTVGGLVVPWISVQHRDGRAALGAVHGSRVDTCLMGRRCQTCGGLLGDRLVLFARPRDFARGYVAEPGMHPDCAAYSAKACPMVNGSMGRYRASRHNVEGKPCGEQGCDCPGWVSADNQDARLAGGAEAWFAVWLRLSDYGLATDEKGALLGIAVTQVKPLKVRPLNDQAREQERMLSALLAGRELLGLEAAR